MCARHGCLLSMLLSNIAAGVLANLINAEKRIKGRQIGDHEIKVVNFTDNTPIFFKRYYLTDIQKVGSVKNP